MADFGLQIAVTGRIVRYSSVNHLREGILAMPDDWSKIQEKWQPTLNRYLTEFREVAPK
jgi:hypothetical protein